MKRAWLCAVLMGIAVGGCEQPCKEGFQRYGNKCARSPVEDASVDTNAIGTNEGDADSVRAEMPDSSRPPDFQETHDAATLCGDRVDRQSTNACGGPCTIEIERQPGDPCTNALLGECQRVGKYVCDGDNATKCDAPMVSASSEICGDDKDNDCDGSKDEADATDATLWYQDCDSDGYAASTAGAQRACAKPANLGACTWTAVIPDSTTKSNWDCNDSLAAYAPSAAYGFPPAGSSSYDLNCDGLSTPDPAWAGGFEVCNNALVNRLNAGESDCDQSGDGRWNGCVVWKGSDGKYTNARRGACPDVSTYRVTVSEVLDPWSLNQSRMGGSRTCGTISERRASTKASVRARQTAVRLGSPLVWSCAVKATGPMWPCR